MEARQSVQPFLPVGVGAVTMGSALWGSRLWSKVCGWEEAQPEAGGRGRGCKKQTMEPE